MTEKRFKMEYVQGEPMIWHITDNGKHIVDEDIYNLLNALHEENQSLKFQLDECRNNKLFSRRQLEKENEQLKNNIKEAYNNERTMIGKSVLKQLMETIQ